MNEITRGPTRRKWTVPELDRLSEHGFFGEHEHVELIAGELIAMAPKGIRHENVRAAVAKQFMRRLPDDADLHVELGWRPGHGLYIEPDFLVCQSRRNAPLTRPDSVHLIIEIAKSSLAYDQGLKAETYAGLGVADYWVINAVTLETRIHRQPSPEGYLEKLELPPTATLLPLQVPALALRLADLDFGDDGLGEDDGEGMP